MLASRYFYIYMLYVTSYILMLLMLSKFSIITKAQKTIINSAHWCINMKYYTSGGKE